MLFALLGSLAFVQPPAARPVPSVPFSQTRGTLAEALATVRWDPAERGVLLAVGAEKARPSAGRQPDAPWSGNLKELVAAFDRMLLPVGNLTVVAPTTMRVVGKPPRSPEEASWQNSDEALSALLASLSKNQWQAITSENGLGLSDLEEKQRGAFLACLPDPLQLRAVPGIENDTSEPGKGRIRALPLPEGMGSVTLTPQQRAGVRLRVNRKLQLMFAEEGGDGSSLSGGGGRANFSEAHYELPADRRSRLREGDTLELPNRAKPSDLDLATLSGTVSLTGAATLGELVKRAAQATGKELYADPRVAALSVQCWGESATARDVLAALCRAVTGTFRQVGPAFVLTHDREGMGALLEPQRLFQAAVSRIQQERRQAQEKAIRQMDPAALIGFAPGDALALPSELMQKIDREAKKGTGKPLGVPVRELPSGAQVQVQKELEQMHDAIAAGRMSVSLGGHPVTRFRSDQVWPRFEASMTLVVPGIASIPWQAGGGLFQLGHTLFERDFTAPPDKTAPERPPVALVWPMGERIAMVQSETADEAKAVARAAHQAGITTLWFKIPLSVARAKALVAAVAAEKVGVGLAISPLDVSPLDIPTGATPDLDAVGTTSDVAAQRQAALRDPGLPAAGRRPMERLIRADDAVLLALDQIARLPGLSSLCLTDLIPPGYRLPDDHPIFFSLPRSGDFGYTLDNRLAFLRKTGCDPIDTVSPSSYNSATGLTFFPPFGMFSRPGFSLGPDGQMQRLPTAPNVVQQWQLFRADLIAGFLPRIPPRLQKAAPQLPIYAMGEGPFLWAGSWDKPEARPRLTVDMSRFDFSNKVVLPGVRQVSKRVFNSVTAFPTMSTLQLKEGIAFNAQDYPGWDGILLDLTQVTAEKALELLRGLSEGKQLP